MYKRQVDHIGINNLNEQELNEVVEKYSFEKVAGRKRGDDGPTLRHGYICLLYTSDAADERSSVDLGGRRIIKKKKRTKKRKSSNSTKKNNRRTRAKNDVYDMISHKIAL